MHKLIVDTNVLVSALIQTSYPYFIVNELFIEDHVQLCISEPLMAEYYDVLNRSKFARFPQFFARAEMLLSDIADKAIMYTPTIHLDIIRDSADNCLLELADASAADYLITGNTTDFTFPAYR